MKNSFIGLLVFVCTGCTHVDVGQVDYRVAEAPIVQKNCSSENMVCDPLAPADLKRRYLSSPLPELAPFQSGDVYSIELEQMVIGERLLEGMVFGKEFGPALGDSAEIAILANVFEFSGADAENVRSFVNGSTDMIAGKNGPDSIKLIYYGDNVKYRQPLNFGNIPLHPRSEYAGRSVGVQLVVMEVDSESGAVSALLSKLADFGKGALPGLPGAKDVIFDLGKSLFAGGSGDDKLLDYRFVLSYGSQSQDLPQANFAPGRYVILREQDRSVAIPWNRFEIDHNTGRLFYKAANGKPGSEVRDRFYMTINIKRYPAGTSAEAYNFEAWSAVRQALEDHSATGAAIAGLQGNLEKILEGKRSVEFTKALVEKWNEAGSSLSNFQKLYLPDIPAAGLCGASHYYIASNRDRAERRAMDDVREFLALYRTALAAEKTVASKDGQQQSAKVFLTEHRETVVSHLSSFFTPWKDDGTDKAMFASAGDFETSFVSSDASTDLWELAKQKVQERASTSSECADLKARGIAPN